MNDTSRYATLRNDPDALISKLIDYEHEIEKLQNIIHNANKKLYGSKGEKLSEQVLFTFDVPALPAQESLEQEVIVSRHTRTVKRGRKPLPNDLPREEVIYEPEETHCPCCKHELVKIGEERSEELEKIPASLKVIEHIRIKKACPACKGAGVLVPPLPPTVLPLERARPGAGLLADIIVSKYVDHLPLYRQEEMYGRRGVVLKRQRMCDWIGGVVELLMPLYGELKREVLTHPYIQADETTIKVQDGEKQGSCHTGYLWGVHAPPNLTWFYYAKSRAGEVPKEIFKGYSGVVQTDAYAGYNAVFLPDTCNRIACLAHVRRKFIEVQKTAGKDCGKILTLIAALYKTEDRARREDKLAETRSRKSKEILEELFTYLRATNERTLPRSLLAKALHYALSQEVEVKRILASPQYQLDNNGIERQMKQIAVGRKNYLFAGSHDGAKRAAVLYSLLNTAKLNKVDPWSWLSDVLRRISSDSSVKAADLLPHRWVKPG